VGLIKPDKGTVRICGLDTKMERVEVLKLIGYVPENPVCFQYLTIREFLKFIWSLRGLKEGFEEALEYYLNIFELEGKKNVPIYKLSRGMLQKVLVSAALMVKPKVLILDEPLSGMDPESQYTFKEEVRKMISKGATVLISSHILDVVEKFCTRVGIINYGRLLVEGTIVEVKKRAESGEDAPLEEVFIKLIRK